MSGRSPHSIKVAMRPFSQYPFAQENLSVPLNFGGREEEEEDGEWRKEEMGFPGKRRAGQGSLHHH